ncbi:hypothetical protein BC940DRAFT_293354 [Gongronella butleri]|nr:hypothetical protein BC940DRAFT_293354 [Gongronella butleri]
MSSDLNAGRFTKKYGNTSNFSSSSSRPVKSARILASGSKVSAPKPVNLPSLRHEHASHASFSPSGTPDPGSAGSPPHATGLSTASPSAAGASSAAAALSSASKWQTFAKCSSPGKDSADGASIDSAKSSGDHPASSSPPSAWANAKSSTSSSSTTTNNTDFPTAAESSSTAKNPITATSITTVPATATSCAKQMIVSHHGKPADLPMPFSEESKPSNMSWDEMVSEDYDFEVAVVEFADGTKVNVESKKEEEPEEHMPAWGLGDARKMAGDLPPSRHYAPIPPLAQPRRPSITTKWGQTQQQQQQQPPATSPRSPPMRDRHGSFFRGNVHDRRPSNTDSTWSNDSSSSQQQQQRAYSTRLSNPAVAPHAPMAANAPSSSTSTSSNASARHPDRYHAANATGDERPPEIAAAQREAMHSAAEQARRRREADEAERQAAAERARQKALALAAAAAPKQPTNPPKPTIQKHEKHEKVEKLEKHDDSTTPFKPTSNVKILKRQDTSSSSSSTAPPKHASYTAAAKASTSPSPPSTTPNTHPPAITTAIATTTTTTHPLTTPMASEEKTEPPAPKQDNATDIRSRRFVKSHSKLHQSPAPIIFSNAAAQSSASKPSRLQFMMDYSDSDDDVLVALKKSKEKTIEPVKAPLEASPSVVTPQHRDLKPLPVSNKAPAPAAAAAAPPLMSLAPGTPFVPEVASSGPLSTPVPPAHTNFANSSSSTPIPPPSSIMPPLTNFHAPNWSFNPNYPTLLYPLSKMPSQASYAFLLPGDQSTPSMPL